MGLMELYRSTNAIRSKLYKVGLFPILRFIDYIMSVYYGTNQDDINQANDKRTDGDVWGSVH